MYIYIYILSHYNSRTHIHYNHISDYFLINDSSMKMLKHLQALPHGYRVTAEESRKVMKDQFQQMIRLIRLTAVEIVFDRIILRRTQAKCGPCFLSKSQKSYAVFFLCFVKLLSCFSTRVLALSTRVLALTGNIHPKNLVPHISVHFLAC